MRPKLDQVIKLSVLGKTQIKTHYASHLELVSRGKHLLFSCF